MKDVDALPLVDIIIFGGHGDLALRKIMPALYHLCCEHYLHPDSRIISTSHREVDQEQHLHKVSDGLRRFIHADHYNETTWERFAGQLHLTILDATQSETFSHLAELLNQYPERERIYYLSTSSSLFGDICRALATHQLVNAESRVVLEKPIGHDLATFKEIDDQVTAVFNESAIYRIDHYLGKDTVQNILALRFSNALFMPLWNSQSIDHIQITVSEQVGVEGRWGYYDQYGAMRDMVQNHLLQLLCLIAMEPPSSLNGDSVRNEKVKVLNSLRQMDCAEVLAKTVRGQYRKGQINAEAVPGYLDEENIQHQSDTETFVALRLDIDNWNWKNVPFYLRTGKRMSRRHSEIVIQFKKVPHSIFPKGGQCIESNKLIIHLQPEESIKLKIMKKKPGLTEGIRLRPVELELNVSDNDPRTPSAYERLLLDVINADSTLFMRRDEVEAAWIWADHILTCWENTDTAAKPYTSGSDGPTASIALIERDGRSWHEDI